jgi:hypothetical protein
MAVAMTEFFVGVGFLILCAIGWGVVHAILDALARKSLGERWREAGEFRRSQPQVKQAPSDKSDGAWVLYEETALGYWVGPDLASWSLDPAAAKTYPTYNQAAVAAEQVFGPWETKFCLKKIA